MTKIRYISAVLSALTAAVSPAGTRAGFELDESLTSETLKDIAEAEAKKSRSHRFYPDNKSPHPLLRDIDRIFGIGYGEREGSGEIYITGGPPSRILDSLLSSVPVGESQLDAYYQRLADFICKETIKYKDDPFARAIIHATLLHAFRELQSRNPDEVGLRARSICMEVS